ncbi:MAG TPA: type IV toxin-antitoxin system AbiEi family antitoxin [Polyangiales bacterium]
MAATFEPSLNALQDAMGSLPFVRDCKVALSKERGTAAVDGVVRFKTPDGRQQTFLFERKAVPLRRGDAERMVASAERLATHKGRKALLLLAPYVDPAAARVLIGAGVSYLDDLGNIHVAVGNRYMAHVEKPGAPAKPAAAKGWRPASYRVLLAMIASAENVKATTRELAHEAGGVSPQTVAELRAKLQDRGLVLRTRSEWRWAPGGYARAMDLWTYGFTNTLAPSLEIGRFRARERDPRQLEAMLAPKLDQLGGWAWGGGAACERLTHFYRGDTTVVYLAAPPATWPRDLGLVQDPQGPVPVMRSPGPRALGEVKEHVVHPALAYADLLRESEPRATEAASELHARYLREESPP